MWGFELRLTLGGMIQIKTTSQVLYNWYFLGKKEEQWFGSGDMEQEGHLHHLKTSGMYDLGEEMINTWEFIITTYTLTFTSIYMLISRDGIPSVS